MKKKYKVLLTVDMLLILLVLAARGMVGDALGSLPVFSETLEKPRIALTFDDGPNPQVTPELLAGLRERGVKATFFVLGSRAQKNPEILEQMFADGHLIGNHTYDHVQLNRMEASAACEQVMRTSEAIYQITGQHTEYVRPPYGEWQKGLEEDVNMIPVLWDVDPLDWNTTNVDEIVKKVVTKVGENDMILLHDDYASSAAAALRIVDILQQEGYEFVTVDALILE